MKHQDFIKHVRETDLLKINEIKRDEYPCLQNLSSAFTFRYLPIPEKTERPEFIFIQPEENSSKSFHELTGIIAYWNQAWESGHLRYKMLENELPNGLSWLSKYTDRNIYLIPHHHGNNYYAFQHLLNLIPARTRVYNGLPLFKKGVWPSELNKWYIDEILPIDFDLKLSNAFAYHIWPLLNNSSKITSYTDNDPIKVLAHNLNFWVPYLNMLIEEELKTFPRIEPENTEEIDDLIEHNMKFPKGIQLLKPRKGGMVWYGEDEAWSFTKRLVETADENGKIREIIDAVRSNRTCDDFSEMWSYEKEDFERKLYRKRNKYKVSFVEINNSIPIQGPNSEIIEDLVWEDFLTLLDRKEKQIVICLKNGYTKMTEISEELGYANHSPVSKSLKRIRKKLEKYIE